MQVTRHTITALTTTGKRYVHINPRLGKHLSIQCKAAATINYDVDYTLDDPASYASDSAFDSAATWVDHATLNNETTSQHGVVDFAIRALRFHVNSISGGSLNATVLQTSD